MKLLSLNELDPLCSLGAKRKRPPVHTAADKRKAAFEDGAVTKTRPVDHVLRGDWLSTGGNPLDSIDTREAKTAKDIWADCFENSYFRELGCGE